VLLAPVHWDWDVPSSDREPDHHVLAKRMGELRRERGLTFEQLAEATGMSRRGVISLEQGHSRGTLRSWWRVSSALGTTFSEFVRGLN